jgi:hypothetical protein
MALTDDIMLTFRHIAREKQEIRLINEYKGVPIAYSATILDVGSAAIRVKTEKYQIVCFYRERSTVILGDLLPRAIGARIMLLDSKNMEATLSKFHFVGVGVGNRTQVRVEPDPTINGLVRSGDTHLEVKGELADISEDGLGIYIGYEAYLPGYWQKGVEARIFLRIPMIRKVRPRKIDLSPLPEFEIAANFDSYSPVAYDLKPPTPFATEEKNHIKASSPELELHGTIVHVKAEPENRRYRLCIRITSHDDSRAVITQFISQRQAELIREIKSLYDLISLGQDKLPQ